MSTEIKKENFSKLLSFSRFNQPKIKNKKKRKFSIQNEPPSVHSKGLSYCRKNPCSWLMIRRFGEQSKMYKSLKDLSFVISFFFLLSKMELKWRRIFFNAAKFFKQLHLERGLITGRKLFTKRHTHLQKWDFSFSAGKIGPFH